MLPNLIIFQHFSSIKVTNGPRVIKLRIWCNSITSEHTKKKKKKKEKEKKRKENRIEQIKTYTPAGWADLSHSIGHKPARSGTWC